MPKRRAADLRVVRFQVGHAVTWSTALLIALVTSCSPADDAAEAKVTVLAAASTTSAIAEVARMFENGSSVQVQISTGPSNGLTQQILAGAPADVFLSANKKWADFLAQEGLASEKVELMTNRLVLIVPKGNPAGIKGPHDLQLPEVLRVAIAAENVPAGIYAEQALRTLHLFDPLQESNKLARGTDVRVALTYVERAEAEAGIVYATDARSSPDVEIVNQFDPQTHDPVAYYLVLLEAASDKTGARIFFDYLQSPAAQAAFAEHGFTPPAAP